MEQLAPGLRRWTAYHEEWRQDVGCVLVEGADAVVLIDPLPGEAGVEPLLAAAAGRPLHVLLTVYYHARSARQLVERHGARLWSTSGARRRIANRAGPPAELFEPGDALPAGIEALASGRKAEVVYWLPEQRALVAGDVLLGSPLRLCPRSWLDRGETLDGVRDALRPVLDLPVERIVVSHGEPVLEHASAELARVLATA